MDKMIRICSQCGKEFSLTDSEVEFYNKKGLQLPKRCKECRADNKVTDSQPKRSSTKKGRITPMRVIVALVLFAVFFFFGDGMLDGDSELPQNSAPSIQTSVPENTDAIQKGTAVESDLKFRNSNLLEQHYQKHGIEMGFASAADYEAAASAVAHNENAIHKVGKEDGDDIYYIEDTNEFIVVSSDGYLRTYFYPSAGKSYFDRQ